MTTNVKFGAGIQAFGNSIPAGNAASVGNSYPALAAIFTGGPLENRSISGSGIQSITEQGYVYHPYGSRSKAVIWDGPLNDLIRHPNEALAAIPGALNAFLSSAFAGGAVPASYSEVAKVGAWNTLGVNLGGKALAFNSRGLYTVDPTASLTLNFSGPRIAVHSYMTEPLLYGTTYKDLNVSIDNGPVDVFAINNKALPNEGHCAAAKIYRNLGAGAHSIKITPPSSGQYTTVDCFVIPIAAGFAPAFIGHVPYLADWTAGGLPGPTQALVDQANALIDSIVGEWRADGFPVEAVRVNDYYDVVRDCAADHIHPHTAGHRNYALAYIDKMRIVP